MLLFDSRMTFHDDNGKPLSGGRLRYYAYATSTPVIVYADADYVTPLGATVALTAAGWTASEVHCAQSVTIYIDRFLGLDEFGAERYENIKVDNILTAPSAGGGADTAIVDTVDDLRSLVTPVAGLACTVKGYNAVGDCFTRTYIFDVLSSAIDNAGTVVASSVDPVGRWLLAIDGPYVDSRIFGVIPGPSVINAQLAAFCAFCQQVKKTAYFGTGSYYLTSGGSLTSHCAIRADKDVNILSTSGTYALTIDGGMQPIDIANTFASTGVTLVVENSPSRIPDTAWGATLTSIPLNFGRNCGLILTKTQSINLNNNDFLSIQLRGGITTFTGAGTATELIKSGADTGKIAFIPNVSGDVCIDAPLIRSSMIDQTGETSVAHVLHAFHGVFLVDDAVGGAQYDDYASFSVAAPTMDIRASFDTSVIWALPNIQNINAGTLAQTFRFFQPIGVSWFATASLAVSSYAYSYAVASLDLQGAVTIATVEKYDVNLAAMPIDVRNGTVKYVNSAGNTVRLNNVVVNRTATNTSYVCVNAANVYAENCTFVRAPGGRLFPRGIAATLRGCTFQKTDNASGEEIIWEYPASVELFDCKQENANTGTYFALNGNAAIDHSTIGRVFLVPQSAYMDNISITNSTVSQITFSSTMGTQSSAIARNIRVVGNTILSSSASNSAIGVSNGSTLKWAITGHKNINVYDNWNEAYDIPCRSTSDQMKVKYTHYVAGPSGYRNYYMDVAKYLFVLNTNDTDIAEGLTGSGLYASYITAQFLGVNYVGTTQGMIFASYFNQWSNSRIYTNNQFWVRCFDHDIVSTDQWYVSWKLYK